MSSHIPHVFVFQTANEISLVNFVTISEQQQQQQQQ